MADPVKSKKPRPLDILLSGHKTHSLGGGIQKAAPFKKNTGFKNTALKPWDICQVAACHKPTCSGEKEKDVSRRYCFRHLPENLAVFAEEAEAGQLRHRLCSSDQKATICKKSKSPLSQEACSACDQRCTIPVDSDGQHSNCRCWVLQEKIEYHFARTLRAGRYLYYVIKGNVQDRCTYLPYIRWNRKRMPFIYGVTKAPKGF